MEKCSNDANHPSFGIALMAGAFAGLAVDISLFPLDTIKTRLQSDIGFRRAGGFHNIYSGIGSVIIGSSPGAATFFCTYETVKTFTSVLVPTEFQAFIHMGAACCGEVASCIIRVPTEVIKQRTQANSKMSSWAVLQNTLQSEGVQGMYRGYFTTVFREIPFSLIQFPIWEYLKNKWSKKQGRYVTSWQSALCGGIAGGVASALTTPIDVAKTRIMLAEKYSETAKGNMIKVLIDIWKENKLKGLFAGVIPRVLWISMGGVIFFGVYEKVKNILMYSNL